MRTNCGACSEISERRCSQGPSTSGIGSSSYSGPDPGVAKAASARATVLSAWISRPDTDVSERPVRSAVAFSATGPTSGWLMNWTVSASGAREGSPIAMARPRSISAAK